MCIRAPPSASLNSWTISRPLSTTGHIAGNSTIQLRNHPCTRLSFEEEKRGGFQRGLTVCSYLRIAEKSESIASAIREERWSNDNLR